jgi:hypothetical protein
MSDERWHLLDDDARDEEFYEPEEPTGEECSTNKTVFDGKISFAVALWYPQMGGYHGKAVAVFDKGWYIEGSMGHGGCVEIYVWHDGEFPFSDSGRRPATLHLCEPEQFIEFGEKLSEYNERGRRQE